MFDNIRRDFIAHGRQWGAQGFWVMCVYRFGRWRYGVKPAVLRKACSLLYHVQYKLVQILTGIELPCEVEIGRNFIIDHFGGIIVSGYAKFGDDCRIRNGVVIGLRRVEEKVTGHWQQCRHRRRRKVARSDTDWRQFVDWSECGCSLRCSAEFSGCRCTGLCQTPARKVDGTRIPAVNWGSRQ